MHFKIKLMILIFYISFGRCTDNVSSIIQETSQSSSIATMVSLLQLEENLFKNLQNYVDTLEHKIQVLKMAQNKMHEIINKAEPNGEDYLSNPLNSFALMRHMHQDWPKWLAFMTKDQIYDTMDSDYKMPTAKDLNESITSMFLMQMVYDLEPNDIAVGLLNGKQYDAQLSALDCFEMGRELYSQHKYFNAAKWLKVTMERHSSDDLKFYEISGFKLNDVYPMHAKAVLEQNRYANDSEVSDKMIKHGTGILKMYSKEHIDGCRGKFTPNTILRCHFNTTASPFLRLAPAKMEELHLNPYTFLIHDMIYDNEIDELKRMSIPELKRSHFVYMGNITEVDSGITSKYHYVPDDLTDTTKRINQRIADISGLDLEGSEALQVNNYGIGGHFQVHLDNFDEQMVIDKNDSYRIMEFGDRILTALLYLSDVDQGGSTVFPFLETAVVPRKGNVLFWYNIHNSGNIHVLGAHGSCPMIVGSKWIATKSMREKAQIFRHKCYQNEKQ